MSETLRKKHLQVSSSASAAVESAELRVGGNLFDVQISAPASLVTVQVSSDKFNWFTATEIGGTLLSGIGAGYYAGIREGADWMRIQVAIDAGGPQTFSALVGVHKQGGNG